MRSTMKLGGWPLIATALALLSAPAHAVEVNDGHATEGTLVSNGPAEFRGDLVAYAQDPALLVLGESDGEASDDWSVEGDDVDLVPLAPLPRIEAGVHAEAELAVNVDATERAGLSAIRMSVQREAEVRGSLDAAAAARLLFASLPEDSGDEHHDAEIASPNRGRLLAIYLLDGVLQVEGSTATGLVLTEAVALEGPDEAFSVGYPVSVNPGAYALTLSASAWTARGSVLALVEGEDGVALVRVRDGAVYGTSDGSAVAYTDTLRGAFGGTLTLRDATGDLEVGPEAHALVGQLVRLTGTYSFEAANAAEPGDPADGRAEYKVKGRTTALALPLDDGLAVPSAVFVVPAALAAIGVLVYFAEVVKFASFAPAMGLFSRIADSELLANEVRDRIHRLVSENPGITIKECQALAAVGWGTTVYHLRRLEDSRMVTSIRDGNYRRFYKNGVAPGTAQKQVLNEMRRQPSVRIAQFVIANPGACQKDLCEALEMSPPLAHKYVRRLLSANLVTSQREWKKVKYYPTDSLHKAANAWGDAGTTVGAAGFSPTPPAASMGAASLPLPGSPSPSSVPST